MEHEPCRLLSDANIAGQLIGADAVLAVRQEPHRREPFLERDGRILENGIQLDGILPTALPTLPAALVLEPVLPILTGETRGAFRASRPAHERYGVNAGLLI